MDWLKDDILPVRGDTFLENYDDEITETDIKLYRMLAFGENDSITLTQENWEKCLYICILVGDTQLNRKLWDEHPEFVEHMMREYEETIALTDFHITEEKTKASWKRFAERMGEEGVF